MTFNKFKDQEGGACQITIYELIDNNIDFEQDEAHPLFKIVDESDDTITFGLIDQDNSYNTITEYPNIRIRLQTEDGRKITT